MDSTIYAVWWPAAGPDEADKVTATWLVAKQWFDQDPDGATVFQLENGRYWDVTDEFRDEIADVDIKYGTDEPYSTLDARVLGLGHYR